MPSIEILDERRSVGSAMQVHPIPLGFRLAMRSRHLVHGWPCRDGRGLPPEVRSSTFRVGTVRLILLMGIVGLSGCQISWPFDRPVSFLDSTQFMDTWKTYLHCRASMEPEEIRADLQHLNHVRRRSPYRIIRPSVCCPLQYALVSPRFHPGLPLILMRDGGGLRCTVVKWPRLQENRG